MSGSLSSTYGTFRPASGITFVNSATAGAGSTATVTTISVTMPSINANDVAVYVLARRTAVAPGTASVPTGFTLFATVANSSSSSRQTTAVWVKKLDGTESGAALSTSWTGTATTTAAIVVYRGVNTTTQVDGTPTTANSGMSVSTTNLTYPSYTSTVADCMYLRLGGVNQLGESFTVSTPTNDTSRVNIITNRGRANYQSLLQVTERLYATAGGTDSGNPRTAVANGSTATFQGIVTLALRPA